MADQSSERREGGTRMTGAWIGFGILVLGIVAWIIYSFWGMATGPEPPPVDLDQPFQAQTQ